LVACGGPAPGTARISAQVAAVPDWPRVLPRAVRLGSRRMGSDDPERTCPATGLSPRTFWRVRS
jgi:hypothetical protein